MEIFKSLKEISTEYTVFEKDQLLTHGQLNSIAGFFDDQSRLSRIYIVGVGIACGLEVSMNNGNIRVTGGIGITTDGDLMGFANDTEFDKFKIYDESNPRYEPFLRDEKMLTLYELVQKDVQDDRAVAMGSFSERTGATLADMVALLFMESYVTDRDLCSGTDCDNLGQVCKNSVRLLIVDKGSLGGLKEQVATAHDVYGELPEIVIARPRIEPSITTVEVLANAMSSACASIHDQLVTVLAAFYGQCSPLLGDLFATDPGEEWKKTFESYAVTFKTLASGIQYYYDFLKDVAETYNSFRELLFGDLTWCCPGAEVFPKHLLLGSLATGVDQTAVRTAFYPSPAVSGTVAQLGHARFLARKIDTLIRSFHVPDTTGVVPITPAPIEEGLTPTPLILLRRPAVRITPSVSEEHPLEERAIPYYYRVSPASPVHENWSYCLQQRGAEGRNYSYHASPLPRSGEYRAEGAAANPLGAHLGRFGFFRIEGHLGRDIRDVRDALEKQIKESNLPFALQAVMAGNDKSRVVKRPGIHYTDLHRFHYLVRQDVSYQLKDVLQFGREFKEKVDTAVESKVVSDSPDDVGAVAIKTTARDQFSMVSENIADAPEKLNLKYTAYKADDSWKQRMPLAIQAAGQFKANLSDVVKTDFTTPFDTLIGHTNIHWLDWLDDIIKKKDDRDDDKLLISEFLSHHPGTEHCAGVSRGGTFVLVYDEASKVVADFMLPYYCADMSEEEPDEPPLIKPPIKPGWVVGNGITILPPRAKFVQGKLNEFKETHLADMVKKDNLNALVQDRLASFKFDEVDRIQTTIQNQFVSQQKDYLSALKDSVNTMSTVLAGKGELVTGGVKGAAYADKGLEAMVSDAKAKQVVVEYLREKAAQPDVSEERRVVIEEQAKAAEVELADAIGAATEYVATNVDARKMDVSVGSEGMAALVEMNKGMETIKTPEAQARMTETIQKVQGQTVNAGLNMMLETMATRKTR
jgi:hypothetical protein